MAVSNTSSEALLFTALKTALEAVVGVNGVYAWNSQYQNEDDNRALDYPYVAIDIETEWTPDAAFSADVELNEQKGTCTVTLHLIYETLKVETDSVAEIYALNKLVYEAVHGLTVDNGDYGNVVKQMVRTRTVMDTDRDQLSDWITVFTCGITELSWQDPDRIQGTPTDLTINSSLDIDNDIIRTGDGTE
jgi:hypothetical protein